MQVRFTRLAALVIALSATLVAGCGKYSISNIRSAKAFQDANAMYSHNDWAGAQVRYEDSVRFNPDLGFAYFFLGHSHQQQYRPTKKDDPAKERGAWELVKFLSSKQSQVTWHTKTGYFPISKAALDDPADKQWVSQKPQFATAIKQLQGTKLTHATQGCSVGEMPNVRKNVENALQASVLQGTDAEKALTDAQNAANKQITDYNEKLGG